MSGAGTPPFLDTHPKGVTLRLRTQPGAGRNAVAGLQARADGGQALKVQVTSPAEGGKANEALIKLLAKSWHLPKSRLSLIAGQSARDKLLLIEGESDTLRRHLALWWKEAGRGR